MEDMIIQMEIYTREELKTDNIMAKENSCKTTKIIMMEVGTWAKSIWMVFKL
jgi:hypothetical protein